MVLSSSIIGKLKVQLKLAVNRLRMTQQKDIAIAKQQRREMAHLLEQNRDASALIRTENIIRSDITTELYELLELYCELLLARSGLLEQTPCDAGLEEAVRSIVYAAPKTEIKELQIARGLLCEKFGKEFATEAMEGKGVSQRVLNKLKVEAPPPELVRAYLTEIARTYGVSWPRDQQKSGADENADDNGDDDEDDNEGGGGGRGIKERVPEDPLLAEAASPPKGSDDKSQAPPVRIAPASPSTENPSPRLKLPGAEERRTVATGTPTKKPAAAKPAAKKSDDKPGSKIPDVDELARRFAELKR